MVRYTADGMSMVTYRKDTELLYDAYVAELTSFVNCVRSGSKPEVTGEDARNALACIKSVQKIQPIKLEEVEIAKSIKS